MRSLIVILLVLVLVGCSSNNSNFESTATESASSINQLSILKMESRQLLEKHLAVITSIDPEDRTSRLDVGVKLLSGELKDEQHEYFKKWGDLKDTDQLSPSEITVFDSVADTLVHTGGIGGAFGKAPFDLEVLNHQLTEFQSKLKIALTLTEQ